VKLRNAFNSFIVSSLVVALSGAALAQDAPKSPANGRWIPAGTFALSDLSNNSVRGEKSYSGSEREDRRVATFLPGMTIVYNLKESELEFRRRDGYLEGETHSGIRVAVLKSALSKGTFGNLPTRDVVIHQSFEACLDLACSDSTEVGTGFSFLIEEEDDQKIVLYNPTNELRIVYTTQKFNQDEARGFFTRVKDRIHPRLRVVDGYAEQLSTACGLTRSVSPKIVVPREEYESSPLTWTLNSKSWSLKALEIFGLGKVALKEEENRYIGTLDSTIGRGSESEGKKVALDFTVFAYRDSDWTDQDFFKFAGLAQTVKCKSLDADFGRLLPRYVENAYLYFDRQIGEVPQSFPLNGIKLPAQISDEDIQENLRSYLPRAFFYSVNSSQEYRRLFELIVDETKILFPSAISNVISRLNASCAHESRNLCSCIVNNIPENICK